MLITNSARCELYRTWKSEYLKVYERHIPEDSECIRSSPIKIAILDTGLDLAHPDVMAREESIKGKHNWLETEKKFQSAVHDCNGHGTSTACLILDYAPDAKLYVAKIADHDPASPRTIAKVSAIRKQESYDKLAS